MVVGQLRQDGAARLLIRDAFAEIGGAFASVVFEELGEVGFGAAV